jgi:heparan-alpha-glucosaminide N-acetyltransferase
MAWHAFGRALILILLGVFLRSTHSTQTNWTFEDTLTQIGLGYGFLFLLGARPMREMWIAFGILVVGYWATFALFPLPAADFDYAKVGVTSKWLSEHGLSGFAAHWQKNSNFAWWFDTWFMNIFPRAKEFTHNGGGYSTLSFVPTLATMILGLIAGRVLRSGRAPREMLLWFGVAGVVGLVAGWACNLLGICPVVKRIWTPSWVLFSGGWCFLLLAAFYGVIDVLRHRGWAFALVVIGMNSIAAYSIAHLFDAFIFKNLKTHLGQDAFKVFGAAYEPMMLGAAVLLTYWLILYWMYRRKVFLRI